MSRPAPTLNDATPEETFLAAIANPWRRELLAYCTEPRSKREVFREFVCAGKKQRYTGIAGLIEAGWLHEIESFYALNPTARVVLSELIGSVVGQTFDLIQDNEACDAAVAALRRTSCRRIVAMLEFGPATFGELRDVAGVPPQDFLASCKTLQSAYTIRDEKPLYALTGAGFPALEGWLNRISVTSGEIAA